MQEPPRVTITDPDQPSAGTARTEVLVGDVQQHWTRVPRRVVAAAAALAVVALVAVVGSNLYRDHQAQARRAAAAFAIADTVHVRLALADGGPFAELEVIEVDGTGTTTPPPPPTNGRIAVPLVLADDADALTEVRDLELTGRGITNEIDLTVLAGRVPGGELPFQVHASFGCDAVAAGRYPVLTSAVATLVPQSGREHRVTVPLTSTPELALQACRLPDPAAVPETAIEEQHGRLLLLVHNIPRSRQPLRVLTVTSPGFTLALGGGVPGQPPGQVAPDTGVFYDVRIRVTDCTAALGGSGAVTVGLRSGRRVWTVVVPDSPAAEFRRPGSTRLLLAARRACP